MSKQNPDVLPTALAMACATHVARFADPRLCIGGGGSHLTFGGTIATVFEDPSMEVSDVEINHTGSKEFMIRGTGFNDLASPMLDFEPPLDSSNLIIKVRTAKDPWVSVLPVISLFYADAL